MAEFRPIIVKGIGRVNGGPAEPGGLKSRLGGYRWLRRYFITRIDQRGRYIENRHPLKTGAILNVIFGRNWLLQLAQPRVQLVP